MSDESPETATQPEGTAPGQSATSVTPGASGGTDAAQPPEPSQAAPQGGAAASEGDDFSADRDYPEDVHPSRLPPALRPTPN